LSFSSKKYTCTFASAYLQIEHFVKLYNILLRSEKWSDIIRPNSEKMLWWKHVISDENINRFQQNKLSKLDQLNKLDEEKRNIRLQKEKR